MSRIRTIKPEYFSDPDLGRISLAARYLYIATWCFADDEGRLPADPRLLKSQAFPYDNRISVKKVQQLVTELEETGKARRYEVGGIHYLFLTRFKDHQKINKPQRPKYPGAFTEHSGNVHGTFHPLSDPTLSDTTPPPPEGDGDEDKLRSHFESKGFHHKDVDAVLEQLRLRDIAGERIKAPAAWGEVALKRLAQARRADEKHPDRVNQAVLDDGTVMELRDGEWVEVEQVAVSA